jgi:predicted ATP-grasp superfamily ATP-dependent carboligase
MTDKQVRPPCYVLGIETQIGLSLVRELGEAGVPVIGIATGDKAIGLQSRYLAHGEILKKPRTDAGLAELRAIGERYGAGYLLTVSEANTTWLIENRDRLGVITPLLPSKDAFAIVLDKGRTLEAAGAVGIDVPKSASPATWADVERVAASFPFPAVLKWSDPNGVAPALHAAGIELVKAEYVYTPDEFLRAAARYRPVEMWPLVQEYCPGVGLGQFFFMHQGKAVRRFQHLRVAEWPPEGGFSSVCDGVPLDQFKDLQEKSIRLLQSIGWEGVAMVEYRYDPASGRAVLMEVNGRFWGSFPLAMYSGAGFGLLAYSLQGQGVMPSLPALRENLRCRMVATEIKRLRRILLQPGLIRDRTFRVRPVHEVLRFVGDFLRPSVCYYVWNPKDVKPFIRDVRNAIGV